MSCEHDCPCACEVEPDPELPAGTLAITGKCTFCDLQPWGMPDGRANVWTQGASCLLDTYSADDIIYVLQHDPLARADLRRITTNPQLLSLLSTVPILPEKTEGERIEKSLNSDPMFLQTLFRGLPPGTQ